MLKKEIGALVLKHCAVIVIFACCGCGARAASVDAIISDCDHQVNTSACWTTAPSASLNIQSSGFSGVTFDGRYTYFPPYFGGNDFETLESHVFRFDTNSEFSAPSSWDSFDTAIANVPANTYQGAVFDGRYVYLVPSRNGFVPPSQSSLIPRYDTMGDFDVASSWASYEDTAIQGGFSGGTFDGRFVYFVGTEGVVTRYDISQPFSMASSWSSVDVNIVTSNNGLGFAGAIFDGRYVYVFPGDYSSLPAVARFDTAAEINTASAWVVFNTTQIVDAVGGHYGDSAGGAYDGRYVYVASANGAPMIRYDTSGSFVDSSAWETYNVNNIGVVNQHVFSSFDANFDGRNVFFTGFVANGDGTASSLALRFDTFGSFTSDSSWTGFNVSSLDPYVGGQYGMAFDGRYLYGEPGLPGGDFVRFDARSPAQEPSLPEFHGSFF